MNAILITKTHPDDFESALNQALARLDNRSPKVQFSTVMDSHFISYAALVTYQ